MAKQTQEELERAHVEVLQAFVLRARRVQAHSFVEDAEQLARWRRAHQRNERLEQLSPTSWRVRFTSTVPDEEQVESLAARVRPFILQDDPVHHQKVMNALLYFAAKASRHGNDIRILRQVKKDWGKLHHRSVEQRQYDVTFTASDGSQQKMTDTALGFAWLFGDVVHADPERRAEARAFGVRDRYAAAVPIVVELARRAIETLNLVASMKQAGDLPDLDAEFDEEVVVTELVYTAIAEQRWESPYSEVDRSIEE